MKQEHEPPYVTAKFDLKIIDTANNISVLVPEEDSELNTTRAVSGLKHDGKMDSIAEETGASTATLKLLDDPCMKKMFSVDDQYTVS